MSDCVFKNRIFIKHVYIVTRSRACCLKREAVEFIS